MSIKLNGATNGSVELDVPAAVGSDLQLTLPATAGDIVVKGTDGSVDLGDVNIDSSGRLLVGTSSDFTNGTGTKLQSVDPAGGQLAIGRDVGTLLTDNLVGRIRWYSNVGGTSEETARISTEADGNFALGDKPSRLVFSTTADGASTPTERMRIDNAGRFFVPGSYTSTTAAAANLTTRPDGKLERSTSSKKYKANIETIEDSYSDFLLNVRPVWFRSLCESDNPDWGYWGFVAEEVAEIDPRLVFWKTTEITYDENGSVVTAPCTPEPEGVQYDRFVPHLLNLIKRQKEQIEAQGTAIASLETRLTALEGGAS